MSHPYTDLSVPRVDVTVIIPSVDEGPTVGRVVGEARRACEALGLTVEVLVIDSDSIDGTPETAVSAGARVVRQSIPGYGAACLRGVEEARGEFLVFVDGDGTYALDGLHRFLEPLRAGYALVVGTRRNGTMDPGSMSWAHRHLLEPLQTVLLRRRIGIPVSDVRCGLRAVRTSTMRALRVGATGMEFASEMLQAAARAGIDAVEVPVVFVPRHNGTNRRRVSDSWRVLRQLLLLSPTTLFLVPGGLALVLGLGLELALLPGQVRLGALTLDYHFMFVGSALAMFGFQLVLLGLYARTYALMHDTYEGEVDPWIARFHQVYTLERGVLLGLALAATGLGINVRLLIDFTSLAHGGETGGFFGVRPAILALTLLVLGAETVFASFFLSILRGRGYGRA